MKTIFEASDLVGDKAPFILGRIIRRGPKDEHWLIGYDAGSPSDSSRYHLVSLRDGMITQARTAQDFVDHLNADPCGFEIVADLQQAEERLK